MTAANEESDALTPPEDVLNLEPPAPTKEVALTQAPKMAPKIDVEKVPELDKKVDEFIHLVTTAETGSPELSKQADAARSMGDIDIRKAAETSNRLLETPVKAIKDGAVAEGSDIANSLLALRREVETLDPAGARGKEKKFLGLFSTGKSVDYFRRYQSSQSHLNAILHSLRSGQDELKKDNTSLNLEKKNLWDIMARLNQYVYIAEQLDSKLELEVKKLEQTDPEKAKAVSQDVLFYVRQKHQDLLTQLAVSIQSYLSLDVIIKNNVELIKGVDRASTTTVSALRTAVIVAQAVGNQKLVLDQVTALNTTTSQIIESTSQALRTNSASIQEQAASSTIGMQQLQKAFENIYATMDSIDEFKAKALDSMSQTVQVLEGEVMKSRSYLDRVRAQDQRKDLPELTID
ncbi:MAG: toxic anion resistance protein [Propionibacteriaceae bacterium]|jgi:uncharacterized protein YaaN involved in tellurite resistance|nr:toxic anion resistance protein [Propionibacteriaceae bacterium]